jgi:hypothetical protein
MHGLPKNLDLSFFLGKTLESISFVAFNIHFGFDSGVSITVMSSFQHQQKTDVENFRAGTIQSLPVMHSALMTLLELQVTSATGDDEATLSLDFSDGQVLRFFEDTKMYEQYTFTDGENEYVV